MQENLFLGDFLGCRLLENISHSISIHLFLVAGFILISDFQILNYKQVTEYLFEFSQLVTIFVDFTKSKSPGNLNKL